VARADLEEYLRLLDALDALDRAGRFESPEADALRDRGEPVWYRLTEAERDEVRRHAGAGGK
jgi:hypothetical protein